MENMEMLTLQSVLTKRSCICVDSAYHNNNDNNNDNKNDSDQNNNYNTILIK